MAVGRVLIVGGGPAGMTAAVALMRRGIECEITELQSKEEWGPAGAGIELQGNALRALQWAGLADDVIERGFPHRRAHFLDINGDPLCDIDHADLLDDDFPRSIGIVRGELHNGLMQGIKRHDVPVINGRSVQAIENGEDAVKVIFTEGGSGEYDLVIGADGIRSVVRELMFGVIEPTYQGYAIIRGHLPRPDDLIDWLMYFGVGRRFLVNPVSEDLIYVGGIVPAPENEWLSAEEVHSRWKTEFAEFGGYVPEIIDTVKEPGQLLYTPISDLLNDKWIKGRVVLIGDAAHATTPNVAQGAAQAMEDAVVLAEELDQQRPITDSLAAWYDRRRDRALKVVEMSREIGARMARVDPVAASKRDEMFREKGGEMMRSRHLFFKEAF